MRITVQYGPFCVVFAAADFAAVVDAFLCVIGATVTAIIYAAVAALVALIAAVVEAVIGAIEVVFAGVVAAFTALFTTVVAAVEDTYIITTGDSAVAAAHVAIFVAPNMARF